MNEKQLHEIEAMRNVITKKPYMMDAGEVLSGNGFMPWKREYTGSLVITRDTEKAANEELGFYAHACENVDTLLTEVRRLRAVLAEYADRENWGHSTWQRWKGGNADLWLLNEHGYTRAENALKDGE